MAFKKIVATTSATGFNAPKANTLVTAQGSLHKRNLATGLLELATAALTPTEDIFIGNENISVADNRTSVNVANVYSLTDEIIADTVANSNAVHNGQRMVINATGNLVNNTGTDAPAGVFIQRGVVGTPAERKIIVVRV